MGRYDKTPNKNISHILNADYVRVSILKAFKSTPGLFCVLCSIIEALEHLLPRTFISQYSWHLSQEITLTPTSPVRFLGKCDKSQSFAILDYFYDNGGNFIDTANNYQGEESETWIGEWMAERGNRDEMVIATKFTSYYPGAEKSAKLGIRSNFQGNHSKSLKLSLEASLQKLQTSYVDVL
jgi:hypothetical protein